MNMTWDVLFVYMSSKDDLWFAQFNFLNSYRLNLSQNFITLGDFNFILRPKEKQRGITTSSKKLDPSNILWTKWG